MRNTRERQVLPMELVQGEKHLADAPRESYFITLCALAAPLAVPQPRSAELKRFRFFIRREVSNGRESLRLAMGYFTSREESERWLRALRGAYPSAYVCAIDVASCDPAPMPPEIDGEEVLRVLQVRLPKPDEAPAEGGRDDGSYTVVSHERTPTPIASAPPMPSPPPARASVPNVKPSSAPDAKSKKRTVSLADTLDDLATSAFSLESDDTGSTTGVRHLRVELARKSKPSSRSSKSPRR